MTGLAILAAILLRRVLTVRRPGDEVLGFQSPTPRTFLRSERRIHIVAGIRMSVTGLASLGFAVYLPRRGFG